MLSVNQIMAAKEAKLLAGPCLDVILFFTCIVPQTTFNPLFSHFLGTVKELNKILILLVLNLQLCFSTNVPQE